jgi:hypothetical protein
MTPTRTLEQLIECLIQVVGRAAVPESKVFEIVGTGMKQRRAFNLADGSRSQNDIARQAKVDQGNLSRTAARWVENGVAFWIGEGKDARLMHIYPVPIRGAAPPQKGQRGMRKRARR